MPVSLPTLKSVRDGADTLKAGAANLKAAFAASPSVSSSSLTYDPASLKHNHHAASGSTGGSSFHGHDSESIAQKLAEYAKSHSGDGSLLKAFKQKVTEMTKSTNVEDKGAATSFAAVAGVGASTGAAGILAATTQDAAFSQYHLLSHSYGFRVVYCILWIVFGVFLAFFGLQSFYWAIAPRFAPRQGKTSRRIMGGGVGGLCVGFLAGSYLGLIVTNAAATRHHNKLTAGGTFAIFLAPGLLFTLLSAHLLVLSRLFVGLLGAVCLTTILTATFGIHTILVRAVLLSIFCVVLTLPLLISSKSRYPRTKRWLLNVNTSLIGSVAFLDGVALFAPPEDASRAWLDLWTLLFAPDNSPSQQAAIHSWGSSAFKGYIAGSILFAVFSLAFEAWFHRNAGESVDDEWNEYLGVYTGNVERNDATASAADRAGMYEPPRSLWTKIKDALDDGVSRRSRGPATYGNIAGGSTAPAAGGFTERPSSRQTSRRASSRTSSSRGPARFERLSKRDGDLEKLDELDSDEDDDGSTIMGDGDDDKKVESQDNLSALPKLTVNYGGYALPPANLPRPPSYRTESSGSSGSSSSASSSASSQPRNSQLSGSTAVSSSTPSKTGGDVLKPTTVYRDPTSIRSTPASAQSSKPTPAVVSSSPPLAPSAGAARSASAPTAMVAATPSLINAIDRIQRAQAQAKEWHAQHGGIAADDAASPYGTQGVKEDNKADKPKVAAAATPAAVPSAPPATAAASSSSPPAAGKTSFDGWWKREVEKK